MEAESKWFLLLPNQTIRRKVRGGGSGRGFCRLGKVSRLRGWKWLIGKRDCPEQCGTLFCTPLLGKKENLSKELSATVVCTLTSMLLCGILPPCAPPSPLKLCRTRSPRAPYRQLQGVFWSLSCSVGHTRPLLLKPYPFLSVWASLLASKALHSLGFAPTTWPLSFSSAGFSSPCSLAAGQHQGLVLGSLLVSVYVLPLSSFSDQHFHLDVLETSPIQTWKQDLWSPSLSPSLILPIPSCLCKRHCHSLGY